MSVQTASLYYRDGGSDKMYHAQIEEANGGFIVNFQFGRRGSTLQTGTKTAAPVARDKAQKIFDKLIVEKTSKGYTPGEDGTPFAGTDKAGETTGLVPQLLNIIDEDRVEQLIEDDAWMAEEKLDGERRMVRVGADRGDVVGSNRKGLAVPLPAPLNAWFDGGGFNARHGVVDGEIIGDVYHVFDLLEQDGNNLRNNGALSRFMDLCYLMDASGQSDLVKLVRSAATREGKRNLFETIKRERGEGLVFKLKTASYVPGRPNSGGNQLKFKFTQSCTCLVVKRNASKRSVSLALMYDEGPVPAKLDGDGGYALMGNVTIPANFEIPEEDALVEVRYLYAYPGGSLYQPVYLGEREDLDHADYHSTLKFKQGTTDDEEG
jgi:bifunctional non-homologous end joining protein LigD